MRLPIGYDIFKELIDNNLDFIDKSLFIKDIFKDEAEILLITRPRRFGKTLNLSMLHHFLAAEAFQQSTKGLFDNFQIARIDDGQYMEHQGKYPVIFVTFKDVIGNSFENAYQQLSLLISRVYSEHRYLLESDQLTQQQKDNFRNVLYQKVSESDVKQALFDLSAMLKDHYGISTWLLIDEYDTPIQSSYIHGYYDEMIALMNSMFERALKTNPYLHKAVMTGILSLSTESVFSGLNNIIVYSVLEKKYSQYFGFTEPEVADILNQTGLNEKSEEVERWYKGHQFGNTIVYNPWSIVNYVHSKGELRPYWVNTSGNNLVESLIINADLALKENFENLLRDIPIKTFINKRVALNDLEQNGAAVWSLLLVTGYLKATYSESMFYDKLYTLEIPNLEIKKLYVQIVKQWLFKDQEILWRNYFLEKLLHNQIEEFAEDLEYIMEQVASVHDVAKKPEAFYHGLMLGLAASLDPKKYEIKSNKESGDGKYDILVIPKDISQTIIILELKRSKSKRGLEKEAERALKQIASRNYESEIKQRGNANITQIGIAFCGKAFKVKSNLDSA